jgi:hypothetical protein
MTDSRPSTRTTSKTTRTVLHAKKLSAAESGQSADANALITHSVLSRMACDSNERYARIERQAYELSQARGFVPGHELDDWLEAEAMIDAQLLSESRVF